MKDFFEKLLAALQSGESCVLVSIASAVGSTPGGEGAKMAVFKDGSIIGTIGGGAVEYESIKAAKECFKCQSLNQETFEAECVKDESLKENSWSRTFSLNQSGKAALGMACGGIVDVCFQYIDCHDERFVAMFQKITELYNANEDVWMITKRQGGSAADIGIYSENAGAMYFGTEDWCPQGGVFQLLKSRPVYMTGETSWYSEPLMHSGYTYVFGGGHVSQALVPVISNLNFKTIIYEDRADFCKKELFPGAYDTILGDFTQINERISINDNDFVLIMTRGHQCDYEVLEQVLRTKPAYLGVIGSKNKIAATKQRLLEAGFEPSAFENIHWPIGLPIKAQTPAEIAISIAAELVLCRAEYQISGGK